MTLARPTGTQSTQAAAALTEVPIAVTNARDATEIRSVVGTNDTNNPNNSPPRLRLEAELTATIALACGISLIATLAVCLGLRSTLSPGAAAFVLCGTIGLLSGGCWYILHRRLRPLRHLRATAARELDSAGVPFDADADEIATIASAMTSLIDGRQHLTNEVIPDLRSNTQREVDRYQEAAQNALEKLESELELHARTERALNETIEDLTVRAGDLAVDREGIEKKLRAIAPDLERMQLAVSAGEVAIWDWDLDSERMYFSNEFRAIFGDRGTELADDAEDWFRLILSTDLGAFQAALTRHLAGQTPIFDAEHRIQRSDGQTVWVRCRAVATRNEFGDPIRLTGTMHDLTEARNSTAVGPARHNPLTGLPNRELFLERLRESVDRARLDENFQYAVFAIDIDRFKIVNDSLGHRAGDLLLQSVADRLKKQTRGHDLVAHVGGDEFVVLLSGLRDLETGVRTSERILADFEVPHYVDGREVTTSASIGVVTSEHGYERSEDVVRDADIAMDKAKAAGKAQCVVFTPGMHVAAVDRLTLEQHLRHAMERDELDVLFQPIVWLETGAPAGFEALIRWHHPTRGPVSPDRFIRIAEENGLIVQIGEWVMRRALGELRQWRDEFPHLDLSVNVNVSKTQLMRSDMLQTAQALLDEFGLEPSNLKLEVTETTIMDGGQDIIPILDGLRNAGYPLAMDDFGTGQSSLATLKDYPIDVLKIDRAFVRDMDQHRSLTAVTNAVVALAHNLSLNVVAEGIETPGQLAQLQAVGCDLAQGYFFARPLDIDSATDFLRHPAPMGYAA